MNGMRRANGADVLHPQVMESVEALNDGHGICRFCNDQQFVIARKPAA